MSILNAFVSGFSNFVSLPITVLNLLLGNFFLVIFFGGLIFFVANTPQADLVAIYDAFRDLVATPNGSMATVIDAILKASRDFAVNVQHNFSPAALSATVTSGVNTVLGIFKSGNL